MGCVGFVVGESAVPVEKAGLFQPQSSQRAQRKKLKNLSDLCDLCGGTKLQRCWRVMF
jgi:hypothetical protein